MRLHASYVEAYLEEKDCMVIVKILFLVHKECLVSQGVVVKYYFSTNDIIINLFLSIRNIALTLVQSEMFPFQNIRSVISFFLVFFFVKSSFITFYLHFKYNIFFRQEYLIRAVSNMNYFWKTDGCPK